MEYNVISADGHIDLRWLPHDLFISHAPAKWKDLVPRVVGDRWWLEGRDVATLPFGTAAGLRPPQRGTTKHLDRMLDAGFYDGRPHPTTPELRIKDQELDGVDAEVIYGVLFVNRWIQDPELLAWVYQTYNTWAADFCKANPQRLVALACLPNNSPEAAAAEVYRVAKLGLRGAELAVSTAVKPLWHRDWDVLWAAVQECHLPISFHTSGLSVRGPTDEQMAAEYRAVSDATRISLFQLAGAEFLAAIIFSGALERFPGMKFVLGECGVGWIPYVLCRMDEEYEDRYVDLLPMKPSNYWRRQGYTTFQHEPIVADLVHLVGEDNIIWGSDYPHPDGVWPDSRKVIAEDLGRLDEHVRRKIIRDTAGKLYGLLT